MATVTDGSYRDRILANVGERDPLASLDDSGRRIAEEATRLGPDGLGRSYAPGKWTGAQVLAHLVDAENAIGFRLRQALAEEGHHIQGFDETAWARRYDQVDAEAALAAHGGLRAWNLALLRRLTPADLARGAVHPDRGPETVETIVRLLAGHDLNHLKQLESIR